jgi:hypothetical protein
MQESCNDRTGLVLGLEENGIGPGPGLEKKEKKSPIKKTTIRLDRDRTGKIYHRNKI